MRVYTVATVEQPPRAQTRDAATRDTVLTPATEAQLKEYFGGRAKLDKGKVWDGYFRPLLDAMAPEVRDEVLKKMSEYSPTFSDGPAGSRASIGDTGGAQMRRWRDETGHAVERINRENEKFYGKKSA